jgi:hypothetical protein
LNKKKLKQTKNKKGQREEVGRKLSAQAGPEK